MKKLISSTGTFVFLIIGIFSFAQTPPERINYQAVARDTSGRVISSNISLNVTFSIYSQFTGGSLLFAETHNSIHTNRYGLFTALIGGVDSTGFDTINWSSGNKFLEVKVYDGNTTVTMPRTQMMSVPYALYAKNSGNTIPINSAASPGIVASGGGNSNKVWKTNASGMPAWRNDTNSVYTAGAGLNLSGTTFNSVWTSSSANIFNNNPGKVGIGTSNPHGKLEVVDTALNLPHGIIGTEYNNNAFADSHLWLRKARGTESVPSPVQAGDEIGFIKFRGHDGFTFSPNDQTEIGAVASENFTNGFNGSFLKFMTTPNGTANGLERMRIDQNGNIGIGTTNPGALLELAGQVKITGGTPGAGKVLTSDNSGLATWATVPSSTYTGGYGITISGGAINSVWTTSGANISNNNSGNVGIGTTNPSALLEVAGQIKITGGMPGAGKVLTSDGVGLASWTSVPSSTYIGGNGITISGGTINSVWTTTGANISNNNSGNVGIGTTNPSVPLEVAGTINISGGNTSELNRAQTGAANLVPIAYGSINAAGATVVTASTANVSSSYDNTSQTYIIHISGETYSTSNYITIVTPIGNSGSGVKAETSSTGGNLIVTIYGAGAFGGQVPNAFQFITFKP